MRTIILAALALATVLVSLPASARERPCGVLFAGSGQRVQTNHLVGPCNTGPEQAGHNGSRGPYFIGLANASRHRRPAPVVYHQPEYGVVQQGYRQQSNRSARYSRYERTTIRRSVTRGTSAAPVITGKMPTIDPKTLSREAYRILGPVEVPPGVGYHFAVTANASDEPKAGCKVIKTGQSADGMYTLKRRICPR